MSFTKRCLYTQLILQKNSPEEIYNRDDIHRFPQHYAIYLFYHRTQSNVKPDIHHSDKTQKPRKTNHIIKSPAHIKVNETADKVVKEAIDMRGETSSRLLYTYFFPAIRRVKNSNL